MKAANLLKHDVALFFSIRALTLWICPQINWWRLIFQTKWSAYVEKGAVDTLRLIKPSKRGMWRGFIKANKDFMSEYTSYTQCWLIQQGMHLDCAVLGKESVVQYQK